MLRGLVAISSDQGFLERRRQVLLSVDRDEETTVLFGEALCLFDALLARPGVTLVAEADDMNGELTGGVLKLLSQVREQISVRRYGPASWGRLRFDFQTWSRRHQIRSWRLPGRGQSYLARRVQSERMRK
jgi:hypothetical protein